MEVDVGWFSFLRFFCPRLLEGMESAAGESGHSSVGLDPEILSPPLLYPPRGLSGAPKDQVEADGNPESSPRFIVELIVRLSFALYDDPSLEDNDEEDDEGVSKKIERAERREYEALAS